MLLSFPGILQIDDDAAVIPAGGEGSKSGEMGAQRESRGWRESPAPIDTSWAIQRVRADRIWDLGFRGEGIVVGMLDTGVNYEHLDLNDRMWINGPEDINGNSRFDNYPDSLGGDLNGIDNGGNGFVDDVIGWDFGDDEPDPMDEHGHGTATASIVAGDGWAGVATGLAPEAEIMVLRVQLTSEFIAAMEYGTANGADLLSSSLVIPCHPGPSYGLRLAGNSLLTSGMLLSQAAGNEGGFGGQYCPFPPPDEIDPPADVPAPWYPYDGSGQYVWARHSGVIAVGATVPAGTVAGYSSRGPTDWDLAAPFDDYPFPPGLAKPDVAAPGSGLSAALLTPNWGYTHSFSGTSAAAPVNSGVIALMLSAVRDLTPVAIDSILETTAFDIDPPGRDSSAGAGRIDAYRAVGTMLYSHPEVLSYVVDDESGDGDGRAEPGETVAFIITIIDSSWWQPSMGLSCSLTCEDDEIMILDSEAEFGDIESGETGDNAEDPFVFAVAGGPARWARFYLEKSDETGIVPDNTIDTLNVLIGHPSFLVVDDDDRDGFAPFYSEVLQDNLDLPYEVWDVAMHGNPGAWLESGGIVLWFTGAAEESTLTSDDEAALVEFLDGGGDLIVCGDNIAQEIAGHSFLLDHLYASFDAGSTADTLILGIPGDPIGDGLVLRRDSPSSMDVVSPASGGHLALAYETGGGAGVYRQSNCRTLFLGFAPELLEHESPGIDGGADLVMRALSWFGVVAVEEEQVSERRDWKWRLFQNAPNPVRSATSFRYLLPEESEAALRIYNIQGQLVRELVGRVVGPGMHRVEWDGMNAGGRSVASGVYFYTLEAGGLRQTRKMVVLH
jgi:subtilisin family serine protease